MHIKSFLKLVEIQTKIASVIPFIFGFTYTLFRFGTVKPLQVLFFFLAMLCFDMFTTALNNYIDFKKAYKKEGFNYEDHNAIVRFNLKESTVVITIGTLFAVAVVFGLLTFFNVDFTVLVLGVMSFSVGILYSAGPIPISRTCFGEIFSGFFMGLIIPFLTVYITIFDQNPIILTLDGSLLNFAINCEMLLPIILVSLPAMFCIANIMLANNICDVEDDLANKRYTLPVHVGRKRALVVYDALYLFAYLDILLCIILGFLPLISLIGLATSILVFKNIKAFHALQTKKDTFVLAVKNMILVMVPLILTITIGILLM